MWMYSQNIVLVTGASGAGKTTAMAALEDLGYHAIDRFPSALLDAFVEEIESGKDPRYQLLALSVTANDFEIFFNKLSELERHVSVLFLTASKEALLLRYKYTRRNHPYLVAQYANSLEDAIACELEDFSKIQSEASIIMDTSALTSPELASRVQRFYAQKEVSTLALSFISFGYRYGLPMDADYVFDVRFLQNPYWEEHLRSMSGNDPEVYHYVIDREDTQAFIHEFTPFLNRIIHENEQTNKHLLTIAIGCTGGQHRSVSFVNYLYDLYEPKYTVFKSHRDVVE